MARLGLNFELHFLGIYNTHGQVTIVRGATGEFRIIMGTQPIQQFLPRLGEVL